MLTYRAFGHPDDVRLASVMDANQQQWTYSYDATGNLAQVVSPTGHTRTWIRNTSGLLTSETHPESGTVLYHPLRRGGRAEAQSRRPGHGVPLRARRQRSGDTDYGGWNEDDEHRLRARIRQSRLD